MKNSSIGADGEHQCCQNEFGPLRALSSIANGTSANTDPADHFPSLPQVGRQRTLSVTSTHSAGHVPIPATPEECPSKPDSPVQDAAFSLPLKQDFARSRMGSLYDRRHSTPLPQRRYTRSVNEGNLSMDSVRHDGRETHERDRTLSLCSSIRPLVGSKLNDDPGPVTYVAAGTAPTEKLEKLPQLRYPNRNSTPAAVTTYAGPAARAPFPIEENFYFPKHSYSRFEDGNVHAHGGSSFNMGACENRERDRYGNKHRAPDTRKMMPKSFIPNVNKLHQLQLSSATPFFENQQPERSDVEALKLFVSIQQRYLQRNIAVMPVMAAQMAPSVYVSNAPTPLMGVNTSAPVTSCASSTPTVDHMGRKERSSSFEDSCVHNDAPNKARVLHESGQARQTEQRKRPELGAKGEKCAEGGDIRVDRENSKKETPENLRTLQPLFSPGAPSYQYHFPGNLVQQTQSSSPRTSAIPGLYPNVVGHGAREGRKNASASDYPGLSDEFLANNLPYLMSVMTGAPPTMQHMPSAGHGEEVARKQSACWQQEQMLNAAQDAASVGNAAYSIHQEHYARMADAASMSNNMNFSPGKRAQRQADVEASLLTSTSTVSSGAVPNPAVSTGQYVSSANSQPISHNIRQKTGQSLVTAVTTVEQSVRELSIAEGGDDRRQSGESGYQSETTPTFPQDSSTAVQEEGVNEIVSDEASTVTPSANTTRIPGKTGESSTSTSSSRRHTSASQTLPTTTPSETTSTPPTPGAAPPPPPSSLLDATGNFKVSEMDVLSEEIWCYHNSVTQTEATLNRKLHLRDMLYYAICPVFPMCGLYVVGSSLNGFGSNSSDMDLCLMITNKDLDQKTDAAVVLNMILSTLRQVEWVSHQQLIFAKVPILRLKFAAPFADITVDLNANNSVAIKNTHLLCYYSSFDWRVRPLVTIVKEWAKRKGMNDANRSSFTSYSLVLMVIHYLQCGLKPAVLPSLQAMYPKRFNSKCDVRSLNVTLPLTPPPDDWVYNDTATLGELLIGFLYYYAYTFDFNRDAMSIRMGKLVERAFVAKRNPNGHFNNNGNNWRSQWRCICIEEPFTHSNTAHSIYDEMVFSEIKAAFRDAYHELDATRDMQRLMNGEPIKAQPPNGGAMVFTTAYEPRSDHVLAVTVPRSAGPSGSTGSMHTARSGRSSCASSTSGGDNETERNRESPLSQLLGAPVSHAATSTTHSGNGIPHHGMRGSGSSHGKRRNGHHMRKGGTGQRV